MNIKILWLTCIYTFLCATQHDQQFHDLPVHNRVKASQISPFLLITTAKKQLTSLLQTPPRGITETAQKIYTCITRHPIAFLEGVFGIALLTKVIFNKKKPQPYTVQTTEFGIQTTTQTEETKRDQVATQTDTISSILPQPPEEKNQLTELQKAYVSLFTNHCMQHQEKRDLEKTIHANQGLLDSLVEKHKTQQENIAYIHREQQKEAERATGRIQRLENELYSFDEHSKQQETRHNRELWALRKKNNEITQALQQAEKDAIKWRLLNSGSNESNDF